MTREGTGVAVQQRLIRLILERPGRIAFRWTGLFRQFMAAATAAVMRFGPAWARREVLGQAVGVWLLVVFWVVPPILIALFSLYQGIH